jgi:hypothetical protein
MFLRCDAYLTRKTQDVQAQVHVVADVLMDLSCTSVSANVQR